MIGLGAHASGPTRERSLPILEKARDIYTPEIAARGGRFVIEEDLADRMVVGSADRRGTDWVVKLSGGLYSGPNMTEDALRFLICHEIGHLIGGAPRRLVPPEYDGPTDTDGYSLLSSEGQSDYYASLKCMRRVLRDENNLEVIRSISVDPVVEKKCSRAFPAVEESALCQRTAMAGLAFLNSVMKTRIAFNTPSDEVVSRTNRDTYPSRQCRLDTILAGALCQVRDSVDVNRFDPAIGACREGEGARPVCWFL